MKEMRRLCVYIVYAYEQAPQDVVDKRPAIGRRPVEKLQIVQKSFRRKTLENKVFFWYAREALKTVIHKLSTFLHKLWKRV